MGSHEEKTEKSKQRQCCQWEKGGKVARRREENKVWKQKARGGKEWERGKREMWMTK